MQDIKQLYDLQELDSKIDAVEQELDAVRARIGDDSRIATTMQRLKVVEARRADVATKRRAAERSASDLKEKLAKMDERLYSGVIKSAKEMMAAQEERDFTQRQAKETEEKLLEMMVQSEELDATYQKGGEVLERLQSARRSESSELHNEEARLARDLEQLLPQRDEAREDIEPRTLHLYDSLRKSRGGLAVSKVERGTCAACRVSLTTSEIQRVRGAPVPMQCGACKRILYIP